MSLKPIKKEEYIIVKGARVHNLKNIDVSMPRNAMIAVTGLSGSGKSSLAFDTIFAEGQRRYIESLSSYARQFLQQMPKPDVDEISGLSPAISIDQKSRSNNPRSTVATITEIYDYLRVLYARVGTPYCLVCERPIEKLSSEEIRNFIIKEIELVLKSVKKEKILGVSYSKLSVEIFAPLVRGRKGEYYQLLYDYLNKGFSKVRIDGVMRNLRSQIIIAKNKKHDIDILIDTFSLTEFENHKNDVIERLAESIERSLVEADGLVKMKVADKESLLSSKFSCPHDGFSYPEIEPRLFSFNSPYGACEKCNGLGTKHFFGEDECEDCGGARLRKEALHVLLPTKSSKKNIVEFASLSIEEAFEFIESLVLSKKQKEIASVMLREISDRLSFLLDVGLHYMTLDRRANTLSGGEAQRIRLASQLGSRLVGATYVLDEPTIGLHQKDNHQLIRTLLNLRDLGNTVIIVEHDEDVMFASDYIIDLGPLAGVHGGNIVVSDYLKPLLDAPKNTSKSRTLSYLREEAFISLPEKRRTADKGTLQIIGATKHNIKNQNIIVPLGKLVVVTGVSGAGKSTFLYDILHENLRARLDRRYRSKEVYNCAKFLGSEYVTRSILIDQSPIGRTPRSNVATYTGTFTYIRTIFAETSDARVRGWKASRFSFNVKGGRCEACQGNGEIAVEMHFLPTVYVTCDICSGKRYDKETLKTTYKGKNIFEVLEMTVEEGLLFFKDIPAISDRLKTLSDVGLDYVKLGQPAPTLSGGEAQRVKISSELFRPLTTKTVYLLDEPTVGLHYDDVENLILVLDKLVRGGNTVIVIEHNLDVVKSADYVIDFGPEGGSAGGNIVAVGTPEQITEEKASHTGGYLKKIIEKTKRAMEKN